MADLRSNYMECAVCGKMRPEDELNLDTRTGLAYCDEHTIAPDETEPKAA